MALPSTIGFCTSLVELHLGERSCAWLVLHEGRGTGMEDWKARWGGGRRARAIWYTQIRSCGIGLMRLPKICCPFPLGRFQCAGLPPGRDWRVPAAEDPGHQVRPHTHHPQCAPPPLDIR